MIDENSGYVSHTSTMNNIDKERVYTVSELTSEVKNILESEFPPLWLEGEISNFRRPSSGHLYFTLKDARSQIQGIMYRSSASQLRFNIEDGMKVLVYGRVTVYERGGQYQIMARIIEPRGVGALQLAFEQLKKKLREEGLFDTSKKKPVPMLPERIGIVTSSTGAALRDILNVINRRFSNIHLIINPVRVQGDEAPPEIASAIDDFNRLGLVDVILVTRGGGSIEDLWAFNSELVARSIYNSKIPVISAVGHEIDWTISDFVADLRVPTPSAAAELVVARKEELKDKIQNFEEVMNLRMRQLISIMNNKLLSLSSSWVFTEPANRIRQFQQQVDELEIRLYRNTKHFMDTIRHKVILLTEKLHAFSPTSVLLRGFSITSVVGKKGMLKSVKDVAMNERLKTYLKDGELTSTVDRIYTRNMVEKN